MQEAVELAPNERHGRNGAALAYTHSEPIVPVPNGIPKLNRRQLIQIDERAVPERSVELLSTITG